MPKQIKQDVLDKSEIRNRIFSIISMACSLIFIVLLAIFLPKLLNDESSTKAVILSSAFLLFTVSCVIHFVTGFIAYKKTQTAGSFFQSIASVGCFIACLLNVRFMLVMLFSSYNNDELAQKVIGSSTMTDFATNQSTNWMAMVVALCLMIVIGVLGVVKLTKR